MIHVKILKVEGANRFWVRYDGGSCPSAEEKQFHHLCHVMNEHFNNEQTASSANVQPCRGEVYIVRVGCREWRRARAVNVMTSRGGPLVTCNILDYGDVEVISKQWLREAPSEFLKLPYQAKLLVLYGLKPLTLVNDFEEMTTSMQPSEEWDTAAEKEVCNLCKEATSVEVDILKTCKEDTREVLHVEVFLTTAKEGRFSLNKRLTSLNFAAFIPDSPDRRWQMDTNEENLEVVTNLRKVETLGVSCLSPQPDLIQNAPNYTSDASSEDQGAIDTGCSESQPVIKHRRRTAAMSYTTRPPDVTVWPHPVDPTKHQVIDSDLKKVVSSPGKDVTGGNTLDHPSFGTSESVFQESITNRYTFGRGLGQGQLQAGSARQSPVGGSSSPARFNSPPPVGRSKTIHKSEKPSTPVGRGLAMQSLLQKSSGRERPHSARGSPYKSEVADGAESAKPTKPSDSSTVGSEMGGIYTETSTTETACGGGLTQGFVTNMQPNSPILNSPYQSGLSPSRRTPPAHFNSPPPVGRSQANNHSEKPSIPIGRGIQSLIKASPQSERGNSHPASRSLISVEGIKALISPRADESLTARLAPHVSSDESDIKTKPLQQQPSSGEFEKSFPKAFGRGSLFKIKTPYVGMMPDLSSDNRTKLDDIPLESASNLDPVMRSEVSSILSSQLLNSPQNRSDSSNNQSPAAISDTGSSPGKGKVAARQPRHIQHLQNNMNKKPVTFSDTEEVFQISSMDAMKRVSPQPSSSKPAKSILKKSPSGSGGSSSEFCSILEREVERVSPENEVEAEVEDVRRAQVSGASSGKRLMQIIGIDAGPKQYHQQELDQLYKNISSTYEMGVLTDGELRPRYMIKIEELNIDFRVREKIFQMDFVSPKLIQQFSWPAVLHGRDVVGIAPRRAGKTMAHLVPLVTLLHQPSLYTGLPDTNGPLVLILSSSWKKADHVFNLVSKLLGTSSAVRARLIYGAGMEETQEANLLNGCDILVATPACLLRMMEKEMVYLHRLCHMVLDDGDILVENFTTEVREVMTKYLECRPEDRSSPGPRQFLLLGTQWTPGMMQFCDVYMQNPLVFVTDKFEAALYGGIKQAAHVCADHQRVDEVLSLLSSNSRGKAVIVTSSEKEAINLYQILKSSSFYTHLAHKRLMTFDLDSVSSDWNLPHSADSQPVLVITDDTLTEVLVADASVVIHFDIPTTKIGLGKRLWCMRKHFKRPICDQESQLNHSKCVSHFLVTKQNGERAPHLIQILQRTNIMIPVQLTQLVEMIAEDMEVKKMNRLCSYVKAYGECRDARRCRYRHMISASLDAPGGLENHQQLPTTGQVKVLVTHIMNASQYFVRLLEHTSAKGDITNYGSTYGCLVMAMNMYYHIPANRQNVTAVEVGGVYSIEDTQHSYNRVQVVDKELSTPGQNSNLVRVIYKDTGAPKTVETSELFVLPASLSEKVYKFQAVEVYICRVKPVDNDVDWTNRAGLFVTHLLQPNYEGGRAQMKELLGKVVLSLGNTLWLDPLVEREQLSEVGIPINARSVRRSLLDEKFAVDNPQHMELLFAACEGKVQLPEVQEPSKNPAIAFSQVGHPVSIRTVKFPEVQDYVEVRVKHVDDPGLIFVQLGNKTERYEDLLEEISDYMKLSDGELQVGVKLGTLVLARHPEEDEYQWFRGKVIDVVDGTYDILYLDHGDRQFVPMDNVCLMPSRFRYLPFQVMECSLAQVEPKEEDWTDEAGDCLYNLTVFSNNAEAVLKPLLARVCDVEAAQYIGTTRYLLELYDTTSEYDVNLNQEIVALGHGQLTPSFIQDRFSCLNMLNSDMMTYKLDCKRIPSLCASLLSTQDMDNRKKIAQNIKTIVGEMSDAGEPMFGSLRCLCRVICYVESAQVFDVIVDCIVQLTKLNDRNVYEVQQHGINVLCRIFARVLGNGNSQLEESITWALAELSVFEKCAEEICHCGGLRLLSDALVCSQQDKAQEAAAKTLIHLICTMNDSETNKILECGVLNAIDHQLAVANHTQGVLTLCLKLILALSLWPRLKDKIRHKGMLSTLSNLLQDSPDSKVHIDVLDCLHSLIEDCVENKEALTSNGLASTLDKLCQSHSQDDPVFEQCSSLRKLLEVNTLASLESPKQTEPPSGSQVESKPRTLRQSSVEAPKPGSPRSPVTGSGRGALIARILNSYQGISSKTPIPGIRQLSASTKPKKVEQAINGKRIPSLSQQQPITRRAQPLCKWSQDRWNVLLSVQVKDVSEDADVASFTHKSVSFRAVVGDTEYKIVYTLYEVIDVDQCEVEIRPGEVFLGLRKMSRGRWPRLQSAKEDLKLLQVDFDRLVDSSSEDDDDEIPKKNSPSLNPVQAILQRNRSKRQSLMPFKSERGSVNYKGKPGVPEGYYKDLDESSGTPPSDLSNCEDEYNSDYFNI